MISWVPLLGKEGLVNQIVLGIGLANQPMEFLLYSDFALVLGMVHLYVIFMIAPIFILEHCATADCSQFNWGRAVDLYPVL